MSKCGPQSACLLLRRRGYILRALAEQLGVGEGHFLNVLAGYTCPRPEVVNDLPSLVGIPVTQLFTEELLAKPYDPSKNPWRRLS